ncbi:MAG: hypothetical protein KGL42_04345 [Betaproteobacteria bacterium]|nr:hypothetical protein [Betaproteobacteria bacterium]
MVAAPSGFAVGDVVPVYTPSAVVVAAVVVAVVEAVVPPPPPPPHPANSALTASAPINDVLNLIVTP